MCGKEAGQGSPGWTRPYDQEIGLDHFLCHPEFGSFTGLERVLLTEQQRGWRRRRAGNAD